MLYREIENMRRRLAGEEGAVVKGWGGRIPVALVYPSSYYIGMSSLGVHAIYKILNSYDNIVCERAFWEKGNNLATPAVSTENIRPLSDFAVIAFSLTYELDYFNIPLILKSCGIPVYARERTAEHPLVIAGGPVVMANPAPVAPFFDALGIGEAEVLLPPLIPFFEKAGSTNRATLLQEIATLPGMYVPLIPNEKPITRCYLPELDSFPVATTVLTRDTEFGDLFMIEAERGCGWGCRFCLVGHTFAPVRFHSPETLLAQARTGLKYRKRLALVGPDVSDYPGLATLIREMSSLGAAVSVSSLRVKPFSTEVLRGLISSGAKTITLAPEAGADRMRRLIDKGITENDIFNAVAAVAGARVPELKLYFMIGLPGETNGEALAIADLVLECQRILASGPRHTRLTITVSPFIPKAGTPWERQSMASLEIIKERIAALKKRLAPQGVSLNTESPGWSEVQAVLARGDNSLAPVITAAGTATLPSWQRAQRECGVNAAAFAHKVWSGDEKLPWDNIDLRRKH
jgi:radical SAM superfamily enzyme YgiQ (UPF0313 family)